MSQPAQAVQKTNGSIGVAFLKLALILAALGALGFSLFTIDVPNKNYFWIAAELVVAVLLFQGAIGSIRRIFRG